MASNDSLIYSNGTIYSIKTDALRYTWAGYFLFVLASSLIGDTTILIAAIKYRAFNLHRVIVVIIKHIAFCDLMVSIMHVFPRVASLISNKWLFGKHLCYLTNLARYYFNCTGVLLICNMTCSKLLLLKYPIRLGSVSVKKAHISCMSCWLAALAFPVSGLIAITLDNPEIYFSFRTYHCNYVITGIWDWLRPFLAITFVFIPSCLVVASTIYLLIIAKNFARRGRESLKWEGIVTTVLTATVYCISCLPYIVWAVGQSIVSEDDPANNFFHMAFFRIAVSFLSLNTMSNFYIYSLSVQSFRDFIRGRMQRPYEIFSSIGRSVSMSTIAASASNGKGQSVQGF